MLFSIFDFLLNVVKYFSSLLISFHEKTTVICSNRFETIARNWSLRLCHTVAGKRFELSQKLFIPLFAANRDREFAS